MYKTGPSDVKFLSSLCITNTIINMKKFTILSVALTDKYVVFTITGSPCFLQWHVSIAFSSPRAQPEVALFWCQMIAHIFLIITPKCQLQIHYTLAVIAENAPISGIPILIFLCIFVTASPPVSHSYICPRREN